MNEVVVSEATRADLPALGEVVLAWEQRTPWMHSAHSAAEITGFIDDAFDKRVILDAGDPAQAYLAFDPETLRIGGLYSNITGSGVGKALMDCIKVGRDYLWLNTHVPNEAAQKFYKREGFVEISNEGAEPSNIMPEIRMEWCR